MRLRNSSNPPPAHCAPVTYRNKLVDKKKKSTSRQIQKLFEETLIKIYSQATISKDKSLNREKKTTSSKIHKSFGGNPVKSYSHAKIKDTTRRKIKSN